MHTDLQLRLILVHGVTRTNTVRLVPVLREQVPFHSVTCFFFLERAVSMIRDWSNHSIGSFRAKMETSLAFSSPDGFKVSREISPN